MENLLDSDLLFVGVGVVVVFIGLGTITYGIISWLKSGKKVSNRIEQFVNAEPITSEDGPKRPMIVQREISGSLFNRTIVNWFKKILQFLGRFTPEKLVIDLEHKLTIAGNPRNMHAGEFYAIRFLAFVAGIVVAFIMNRDFKNIDLKMLGIGALVILICYMYPSVWLNGKVRARQDEIQRGLPDALDMLSVCASAGLAFDQSLLKISGYWDTDLGHEIKRVTKEMEMGISRATALRNMSTRLDVDDLSRFVAIIIQAEKVGMSYADVLHSQALQMRVQRQFRAREIANKLPGKMLFPIALLIFPAMLAVILGPSIPAIMDLFGTL
ncbi:MAG: type II secretion system F family protein [Anaerolineaceae bacterium]|nr:type II secretion system F family protein [Anaerolineaceae bacterium]